MATFPAMSANRTYLSAAPDVDEGRVNRVARNGAMRSRIAYPTRVRTWTFRYPYVTKADWAAVESFYATNANIPFDFNFHDGATNAVISMRFVSRPKVTEYRNGESVAFEFTARDA